MNTAANTDKLKKQAEADAKQFLDLSVRYQLEEALPPAVELKITNDDEYNQVGDYLVSYKKLLKKIEEHHAPLKKEAKKKHTEACDLETSEAALPKKAITLSTDLLKAWRAEQEAIRLAEQKKQNDEVKRLADEQQAALLAQAAQLEASGDKSGAAEVLQVATEVKTTEYTLTATTNKTERTASGTTSWIPAWEVEVLDVISVLQAIFRGELNVSVIEVKEARIAAWAKSKDLQTQTIHGCKITRTERPAVR